MCEREAGGSYQPCGSHLETMHKDSHMGVGVAERGREAGVNWALHFEAVEGGLRRNHRLRRTLMCHQLEAAQSDAQIINTHSVHYIHRKRRICCFFCL